IAWITGNDFRDLAQRNNIQAPYALNVGQTLQVGNASGTPITGGNAITQADAAEQGVVIKPAQNSTVASNPGDIEKCVAFFHGIGTAAITAFRN
ncbi:hypothetical protein Q0P20_14085, partial [Staphylococcus aureus]|nr:hypothetical protein [Staphylococcus aureus]